MKRYFLLFWLLLPLSAFAQEVQVVEWAEFEQMMNAPEGTVVFNFWATWCRPCVAELPAFVRVAEELGDENVRFVFVSLNFDDEVESKVKPFMQQRNFEQEVVLLNELDANSWIDKISPSWGGSIPATLFVRNELNLREFHEGDFTYEELLSTIEKILNAK